MPENNVLSRLNDPTEKRHPNCTWLATHHVGIAGLASHDVGITHPVMAGLARTIEMFRISGLLPTTSRPETLHSAFIVAQARASRALLTTLATTIAREQHPVECCLQGHRG